MKLSHEHINSTFTHSELASLVSSALTILQNPGSYQHEGNKVLEVLQNMFNYSITAHPCEIAVTLMEQLAHENEPLPGYRESLMKLNCFLNDPVYLDDYSSADNNILPEVFRFAYYFSLFEDGNDTLDEPGILFKIRISENSTDGYNNQVGFVARFFNYLGSQILEHQEKLGTIIDRNELLASIPASPLLMQHQMPNLAEGKVESSDEDSGDHIVPDLSRTTISRFPL